jgi:hypothetical protein
MTTLPIPLPSLSAADPQIAGEGSLDPLGLAQIADRLADHLLPGIRARMRRVRFVTASAVGALASDDLFDVIPSDGVSSPSVCFEWLVLEAFARASGKGSPLETAGVPGSAKVREVLARGNRLAARNYLKSPNVFGFTGVYLPLARHFNVLDESRMPASNTTTLLRAWEADQGLDGFTDATPRSEGARLRAKLNRQVLDGLRAGHCAERENGQLWSLICKSLHPLRPGEREQRVLTGWFTSPDEPVRSAIAKILVEEPDADEQTLVGILQSNALSSDVSVRLDAIVAYERLSWLLDAAFRQLRHVSTHRGTASLTVGAAATDPVVTKVAVQLPGAMRAAADALEVLDGELALMLGERLGRFELAMNAGELAESLMAHHEAVQAGKAPKGKRPWFDRHGHGWVVRSLYSHVDQVDLTTPAFVHPYRLASLQTFMKDITP